MAQATDDALTFAELLTKRYGTEAKHFTVSAGKVWDKIMHGPIDGGRGGSVHAFVNRELGTVHKAEGLSKPVPRARYANIMDAYAAADRDGNPYGGYLYLR
jgi:hypothetical protein